LSLSNKIIGVFGRDMLLYVVSIFTGVLIARNLGPEILGYWMILTLITGYAEAFARPKTDIASIYFIGKNIYSKEDVLFNLNIISLFCSLLIISIYLCFFNQIYSFLFIKSSVNLRFESLIILIQIPIQFLSLNYSYFHISQENTSVYNKMTIINAWTNSILALIFILIFKLGIISLLIATIFSSLFSLIYGRSQVSPIIRKNGIFNLEIIKAMLKYSKYFYLSGILGQLQDQATKTISLKILNSSEISYIGQGQGIGKMLLKVTDAMNVLLFPRVSKTKEIESVIIICKAFKIAFIILFIGSLLLLFFSKFIIVLLYGEAFITSATIIKILLPGLILSGAGSTLIAYFNGSGRARSIPILQLLPLIIQLLAGYFLINRYSTKGSAYALSLGMSCYGISLIYLFQKNTNINIKQLIPTFNDFKLLFKLIYTFIHNLLPNKKIN
jgi:O-antigen/teichoic acid export membrane protein